MKTPEEFLTRGTGRFVNCTDYDDAIKAMKEYAEQEVAKVISSNPLVSRPLPTFDDVERWADKYSQGTIYEATAFNAFKAGGNSVLNYIEGNNVGNGG